MQKLTFNFNLICFSIFLLNVISVWGMEEEIKHDVTPIAASTRRGYSVQDLLKQSRYCIEPEGLDLAKELTTTIKNFMRLRATSESCNRLFTPEKIGSLCKSYPQEVKNNVLRDLVEKNRYSIQYKTKRLPILMLVYAGARVSVKINNNSLFEDAIAHNDVPLMKTLFKYHTYQDLTAGIGLREKPSFFLAKTVEMAETFIKNKVNVHTVSSVSKTNILWELVNDQHSSELMEFYCAHKVDVKKLRPSDHSCLLHRIALFNFSCSPSSIKGPRPSDDFVWSHADLSDNFLRKVTLLLDVIPGMINELNCNNETPLDIAQKSLKNAQMYDIKAVIVLIDQLILLFRKQGALTARELKEQALLK